MSDNPKEQATNNNNMNQQETMQQLRTISHNRQYGSISNNKNQQEQ